VFADYWDDPGRSAESDLRWLARQCHKELVDGVEPRVRAALDRLGGRSGPTAFHADVNPLETVLVEAVEELRHLHAFLAAWVAIAPQAALPPSYPELRDRWGWPENDALQELRRAQQREHGAVAARATLLTEGGGATLYVAGAARAGFGPADDAIAIACRAVVADEEGHAAGALRGIGHGDLDAAQWELLERLAVAQLEARVAMRRAQFELGSSDA
jgi:hypothetical protein